MPAGRERPYRNEKLSVAHTEQAYVRNVISKFGGMIQVGTAVQAERRRFDPIWSTSVHGRRRAKRRHESLDRRLVLAATATAAQEQPARESAVVATAALVRPSASMWEARRTDSAARSASAHAAARVVSSGTGPAIRRPVRRDRI